MGDFALPCLITRRMDTCLIASGFFSEILVIYLEDSHTKVSMHRGAPSSLDGL